MDVRPGYKKTDGGIIPEDWDYRPIAEYARLESGHTPSKKFATYWNGSIPWVSLHDTDLLDRNFIDETSLKITELGLANSSARLLPVGTVVFSRTATVGKASIITQPMATSQDFANYICGPRLFNQYLVYLFRAMQPVWKSLMAGSTHNTIYMPAFKRLRIVIPPLAEQRAIVETLVDIDEGIDALSRLIAKKRDVRTGAMQYLLSGESRLPDFAEPWKTKRLAELGKCLRGVTYDGDADLFQSDNVSSIRLLRANNVQAASIRLEGLQFVNRIRVSEKQKLRPFDIVICTANGSRALVGKSAIFDVSDGYDYTFGAFMGCFRTDQGTANPVFLHGLLNSDRFAELINVALSGSTINNLSPRTIEEMEFLVPEIDEQNAVARVLSDMDAEITALEARLEKTRALKQGMMQALLTGRVRLPVQGEALDALEVAHA